MQASRRRPARWALAAILLLPAAASLCVLGVRIATVAGPAGPLSTTTSGESVQLLNMLKVQRGLPLYDRPTEPPFYPVALYNAGFYAAYAWATAWLAPAIVDLTRGARLFSLALACLGLGATLAYGLVDLRRRGPGEASPMLAPAMVLAALATAFGGLPGWWVLSIRPDIGAAALGAVGLALAFTIGPRRELTAGLAAGAAMAVAWSFKQSCVLVFGGLLLAAMYQRRWRFLAGLVPPVVATIAGLHLLLGPEYRYNTVFATSLAGFDVQNVTTLSAHLAIKGILPLAVSILALATMRGAAWLRPDERIALAACAATTLFGGLAACLRNGSAMNYFFEFNAVAGFLAVILARRLVEAVATSERSARPALAALAVAVACASAQDVLRLAAPARFDLVQARFDVDRKAELDRVRTMLREADGPVYCQPALSGLSLDLPFPVYTFDDEPFFHRPAALRGLLKGPGVQGQMAAHHFRMMVVEAESDGLAGIVRDAGYVEQPGWTHLRVFTLPPPPMTARR
ncbi:hypothetical protein [Paludisphaera mucosa]|uniref:Glycosyltransferase RgtA/B/C/D-like domain-containing protein n=1 Tax=Paludisphaera mucosa TaxID=3030827 RepID=A0ABT6FJM8_9BACT|nr:hypothetical protein [Paludisphaera mucosa]MDG3007558.1 hypothetical protein [Paludisphaera mucosa]